MALLKLKDYIKGFTRSYTDIEIDGIPAFVGFRATKGCKGTRVEGKLITPDEPPGYEIEYVFDRRGYQASWLEKKISSSNKLREQFEEMVWDCLYDSDEFAKTGMSLEFNL